MKKIFGIEAEFNITADEDVVKGIGKGLANGSLAIADIAKELKPDIVQCVRDALGNDKSKK